MDICHDGYQKVQTEEIKDNRCYEKQNLLSYVQIYKFWIFSKHQAVCGKECILECNFCLFIWFQSLKFCGNYQLRNTEYANHDKDNGKESNQICRRVSHNNNQLP